MNTFALLQRRAFALSVFVTLAMTAPTVSEVSYRGSHAAMVVLLAYVR
jgi:hypothetical protein